MYEGVTVAAVIPAYNDEGTVGNVIETVPGFVDRVYVVNDCSTDGTWTEIRETLDGLEGSERPGGSLRLTAGESRSTAAGSDKAAASGSEPVTDGAGRAWRDRIVARDARTGTVLPDRIVVALRHRESAGVGGAITTGYRDAMADDNDTDVVAVMNGDG